MLFLYQSSDVVRLADTLAEAVRANSSVFAPHFVVTGHSSTYHWLREHLAHRNGISAHFLHKSGEDCLEMIYQVLEAGPSKSELLKPSQLVWILDKVLQSEAFLQRPEVAVVADYLKDSSIKRFSFSEKMAQLFVNYQQSEPELIRSWNRGELRDPSSKEERWQLALWTELKKQSAGRLPDRTQYIDAILNSLKSPDNIRQLKLKVPAISFFGSMTWTSEWLRLLQTLSNYLHIRIFYQAPPQSSDPLLEYLGSFYQKQSPLLNGVKVTDEYNPVLPTPTNRFQALKQQLHTGEAYQLTPDASDDSLLITSHFSIMREVDALYHYLLRQLAEMPDLKPRDICVMVPNVKDYLPALKTHFEQADCPLPYTVFDSTGSSEFGPLKALEALFNFDGKAFTNKQVLGLLEYPSIRNRVGITDLAQLKTAVDSASIRHGFEGSKELETHYVSWKYGLKRLIYGFCLPQTEQLIEAYGVPFYPVGDLEESQATNDLMRLSAFVDRLYEWTNEVRKSKTASEWVAFFQFNTLEAFLELTPEEEQQLARLISDLAQLSASPVEFDHLLDFPTLRYYWIQKAATLEPGSLLGFGGIRVVGPNPYQMAPSKIVAFLGLNGNEFPRQTIRLSFDLSKQDGTNTADLDKLLFLQVLLQTERKCWLSYQGQDIQNNSEIPPSVLIQALEATLSRWPSEQPKQYLLKYPLHPFSKRYSLDPALYRFGKLEGPTQRRWQKETIVSPRPVLLSKEPVQEIDLQDLIKFWKEPIEYYYNTVLKLYLSDKEEEQKDSEHFELNKLESWPIKQRLLDTLLAGENIDLKQLREEYVRSGKLPLRNLGNAMLEKMAAEAQEVHQRFQVKIKDLVLQSPQEYVYEPEGKNWKIRGKLNTVYIGKTGCFLAFCTSSAEKYKYRIETALQLELLRKSQPDSKPIYVTGSDKGDLVVNPGLLDKLVEHYLARHEQLLGFSEKLIKIIALEMNDEDLHTWSNTEDKYDFPPLSRKWEYQKGYFKVEQQRKTTQDLVKVVMDHIIPPP